jgi:hypothetical protein
MNYSDWEKTKASFEKIPLLQMERISLAKWLNSHCNIGLTACLFVAGFILFAYKSGEIRGKVLK